jgi:hypothetical protein
LPLSDLPLIATCCNHGLPKGSIRRLAGVGQRSSGAWPNDGVRLITRASLSDRTT